MKDSMVYQMTCKKFSMACCARVGSDKDRARKVSRASVEMKYSRDNELTVKGQAINRLALWAM